MALARGVEIPDSESSKTASAIERKAYTAAEVSSNTTTGFRPHVETTKGYTRYRSRLHVQNAATSVSWIRSLTSCMHTTHWRIMHGPTPNVHALNRKLAELVLEAVESGGKATADNGASSSEFDVRCHFACLGLRIQRNTDEGGMSCTAAVVCPHIWYPLAHVPAGNEDAHMCWLVVLITSELDLPGRWTCWPVAEASI